MSEPWLGQIILTGYNFAQRGFAKAQGQLLPISSNSALFSLYGTIYGGDGRTSFGLPDLRGRVPMGTGSGPGLTPRTEGQKGGAETTTLTSNNVPPHSHIVKATNAIGDKPGPGQDLLGKNTDPKVYHDGPGNVMMDANMISGPTVVGSDTPSQNLPFNNIQPFLVLNYQVALQGVFPSRN